MPFVIPDQNKIKIKATPKKINIYVQATSATRLIEASTGVGVGNLKARNSENNSLQIGIIQWDSLSFWENKNQVQNPMRNLVQIYLKEGY